MYISTVPALYPQRSFGAYRVPRTVRVRRRPMYLGASQAAATGVQIAESGAITGATAAVAMIPVVGPFLAPLVGPIASLFTGHHAAAVRKEGQTLNVNTPNFLVAIQQTMQALQAGQMSPNDAIAGIQAAQANYYSSVASIIKKSGQCTIAANGLDAGPQDHYHCSTTSDPCNAACCIGCNIVEPAVRNLIAIIRAGGGTYTIPSTPNNGAIQGTPSFSVTYAPGAMSALTSGTIAGMPTWVWFAGGGVLLLFLFMGGNKS